jgi:thioredoxin 1
MKTVYALLSAFILLMACQNSNSQSSNGASPKQVEANSFSELIKSKKDAQLIDVRTPSEFQSGFIAGALNLDINGDDYSRQVASLDKSKPVLVYCLSGGRSASAARGLRQSGFQEVTELEGGIMAWNRAGLPLEGAQSQGAGMSETEFIKLTTTSEVVLVDFNAPWCAPCKKMKPILSEIEKEMPEVKIHTLSVDQNKELAQAHNIEVLPTLIVYKAGKEVWRHEGIISKDELMKALHP